MPEKKEKKVAGSRLKIFVFALFGDYASGVVVVVAGTLKNAQKKAFEKMENGYDKSTFGIDKPEDFVDYTIEPIKPGVIAYHSYAE